MYTTRFTVKGTGTFPFDMLRYDAAFPASERESVKLYPSYVRENPREAYTVELCSCNTYKGWQPTTRRWNSFGWEVVIISTPVKI